MTVADMGTHPRTGGVRTFGSRRGRMRAGRLDALHRLSPRFGVRDDGAPLDPARLFGRSAPLVLEIGSGMGEATVDMAAADQERDFLAVEAHTAGVANLLLLIEAGGVDNVRVVHGDAVPLVRDRIAPHSLAAIHVFFPDPWPKARHKNRRLIQSEHVRLFANRMAPDAILHCATDAPPYARQMLATLSAEPALTNLHSGFASRPIGRPLTRYEQRAVQAGRVSYDLVFRRRG